MEPNLVWINLEGKPAFRIEFSDVQTPEKFIEYCKGVLYQATVGEEIADYEIEIVPCNFSGYLVAKADTYMDKVYLNPWKEEAEPVYYAHKNLYEWGRDKTFTCTQCNRNISEHNGSHCNYRAITIGEFGGDCNLVCLKCLQDEILRDGIDLSDSNNFPNYWMFYNKSDLQSNGWELYEKLIFVDNPNKTKRIFDDLIEKAKSENLCFLIDINKTGLADYIDIHQKPKNNS